MAGNSDSLRIALALGAALFFVSGWALALVRERRRRQTAIRLIHQEIKAGLDAALHAEGAASIPAAEAFVKRVRLYLGPLLDIGSGEGKALADLEKALRGMITETPAPQTVVSVVSQPGPASAAASASGGASSAAAAAGGVGVAVAAQPPLPPPPATVEREASMREHIELVRYALMACAPLYKLETLEKRLERVDQALRFPPRRDPKNFGEGVRHAAGSAWHGLFG
jgi:hypothetical protein